MLKDEISALRSHLVASQQENDKLQQDLKVYDQGFLALAKHEEHMHRLKTEYEGKLAQLQETTDNLERTQTKNWGSTMRYLVLQASYQQVSNLILLLLKCQSSPRVYALLIKEKWILLQLETTLEGHTIQTDDPQFFAKMFSYVNDVTKNQICEFYLYGLWPVVA